MRNTLTPLPSRRHVIRRYSGRSLPFSPIKLCRVLLPGRRPRDRNSKYFCAFTPVRKLILRKIRCKILQSFRTDDIKMSLALFTICLISGMYGSEAVGGQCKISERSVPGKALKGYTFKEFSVRAIVECQNTCERDPRCASYNFYIPGKVCELNSQTKEERPEDFVTDELRFYMRREGTMIRLFLMIRLLPSLTDGIEHVCMSKYDNKVPRCKSNKIAMYFMRNISKLYK